MTLGPLTGYNHLLHLSVGGNGGSPIISISKSHWLEFTGTCKIIYWKSRLISEEHYNVGETKVIHLADSVFYLKGKLPKPWVFARRWLSESSLHSAPGSPALWLVLKLHMPPLQVSHTDSSNSSLEKFATSSIAQNLSPLGVLWALARRALLLAVPQSGSRARKGGLQSDEWG